MIAFGQVLIFVHLYTIMRKTWKTYSLNIPSVFPLREQRVQCKFIIFQLNTFNYSWWR